VADLAAEAVARVQEVELDREVEAAEEAVGPVAVECVVVA
jgi:hypothetical protein